MLLPPALAATLTTTATGSQTPSPSTSPEPPVGRAVTLASTACSFATGLLSVSEIVVVTSAGYNIARAAFATATSAYAATPPGLAIDGVVDQAYPPVTAPGDFWAASSACTPAAPQALTLTLPWPVAITTVSMYALCGSHGKGMFPTRLNSRALPSRVADH